MVKNYTAVQNDVNLNVSSEEFNRKESNDGMENTTESVHSIFCCGAKNLKQYGGFETFLDKLTEIHASDPTIQYYITTKANGDGAMDETKLSSISDVKKNKDGSVHSFKYHNANVVKLRVPQIGSAQAIAYDVKAFKWCLHYISTHRIKNAIIYVLACRIGPFFGSLVSKAHKLGAKVYVNPDGACEIIGSTGEKPVKSRLHGDSVFYPNSNTEYHIKNICSGILKRFCYIQMLLRQSGRAFFCWAFSKPLLYDPGIA